MKQLLVLIIGMSTSTWASGAEFTFSAVNTHVEDDVYYLNARIDYVFSDEAIEALESGVPLDVILTIEVFRDRPWWWDARVAKLKQRYQLLYHALSNKYIVRNLNSGAQASFPQRSSALAELGSVDSLPLIDRKLLEAGAEYWARTKVELDIEALPAPMRPLAYISSQWRLGSDWYNWRLYP